MIGYPHGHNSFDILLAIIRSPLQGASIFPVRFVRWRLLVLLYKKTEFKIFHRRTRALFEQPMIDDNLTIEA